MAPYASCAVGAVWKSALNRWAPGSYRYTPARWTVTWAGVIRAARTELLVAASTASASALARLLFAALPSRVRAPARAATSAADWAWVRATAIMPTSMARATNPSSPTRQTVTSGRSAPGRRAFGNGLRMATTSPRPGGGQLASDPMSTVTVNGTSAFIPIRPGTTGLYVPVTWTAICWWKAAVVQAGLPAAARFGGLAYR